MEKTVTLEEALKRIEELEKENAELREELEYYRNRKLSGVRNITPSGWQFIMILLLDMRVV